MLTICLPLTAYEAKHSKHSGQSDVAMFIFSTFSARAETWSDAKQPPDIVFVGFKLCNDIIRHGAVVTPGILSQVALI